MDSDRYYLSYDNMADGRGVEETKTSLSYNRTELSWIGGDNDT